MTISQAILLLALSISCPAHAAVVSQSGMKYTVAETAQLQMEGGASDLKATDLKIYWGSLGACHRSLSPALFRRIEHLRRIQIWQRRDERHVDEARSSRHHI